MDQSCLICNARGPLAKNHIQNIFSESNNLPSRRKLLETIEDILQKPLNEDKVHSKVLCRKCYKTCLDYDGFKSKMNIIQLEMGDEYKRTLQKLASEVPIKEEKLKNTVVVPASKLLPVPADFQLNFSQLTGFGQVAVSRVNTINRKATPLINLKVTIGSSVFTQSLKTSTVKIGKPVETVDTTQTVTSIKKNDLTNWNVNILPKDIFSTNEDSGLNGNGEAENNDDDDRGDENEMEIDEDCTLAVTPVTSTQSYTFDLDNVKSEASEISEETRYINMDVLPTMNQDSGEISVSADGNFVLGKLKILNEGETDDDDQHTIVVDSDNASILEMMAGQKLIYENGELSLVMQEDEVNENDAEDGQESNDESQIELQVSGDEETANAIIAAAQEKGGAFIKVESGEMYRVRSVQSTESGAETSGARSEGLGGPDVSSLVITEGTQFICALCHKLKEEEEATKELLDATAMMRHLKTEHDAKVYLCHLCGGGMRKRQDYTKHMAEHSSTLPATKGDVSAVLKAKLHECSVCKKCYTSRTLLSEHMNTHTGARPYRCHLCRKGFASKYTHQAHLKTHQNRPRPFKCKECSKSFLSQQNLSQHEKIHLGIKNFICNVCNKAFGTQHNLEVHGVVHSGFRPFECTYCMKRFARRAELTDHVRIHTGERPFSCETCGAVFAQRSNLHSHRRATHLHDTRHTCPDCPKRFKRRRLLEYHIKAAHTGERPIKCGVCGATFVYPEHYKKHIRIHSGERPYFCEICGKSFSSRDNRNTHRFTHSDKKPYECLACGQSYMRKRMLIAHMNATGHLAESIVVNQPRVTRVHNTENGVTTIVQLNDKPGQSPKQEEKVVDAIFHTSGKLELLDEKSALAPATETKLFIGNAEIESENDTFVEATNSTQSETVIRMDESGSVLRFIQVKLPDGNEGWVALND